MTDKERLIELIKNAEKAFSETGKPILDIEECVADYLLENGVVVLPVPEKAMMAMDRLTVKSEIIDEHYTLKCMCGFGRDGVSDDEDACYEYCELWGEEGRKQCEKCGIQQAFDCLAAYENTGLSPAQITTLIDAYKRLYAALNIIENTIKAI